MQKDIVLEANQIYKKSKHHMINSDNWSYFQQNNNISEKKIYIMIPVGIPGMGKSHYIENVIKPQCEEMNIKLYVLWFKEIFNKFYDLKIKECKETRVKMKTEEIHA